MDDRTLRQHVIDALGFAPIVDATRIGVTVRDSVAVRYPDKLSVGDDTLAECYANVLRWNPHVPCDAVQVKVEKSCVTLTGSVPFYHTSRRTDWRYARLGGVTDIVNMIAVQPPARPDEVKP